jgi:glycosyltransferase involved in cell wall biosynthesis
MNIFIKVSGILLCICTLNFPQELKTSIIIPCYYGHFKYLDNLLQILEKQSILPDEVVISLSESGKVEESKLKYLKERQYLFPVKLIEHEEKLFAGYNRNSACENASGDIFICQDADDIPHSQRVEIIKYFFQNYDIQHIIHNLILDTNCPPVWYSVKNNAYFGMYAKENLSWTLLARWDQLDQFPYHHNGNIAVRKEVFEKIKWTNIRVGEDDLFNRQCFYEFKKTAVIDANLVMYRQQFSSRDEIIVSLAQYNK